VSLGEINQQHYQQMENKNFNPLEMFHLLGLQKKIDAATDPKILFDIIHEIENSLNFIKTTLYDNPFFLVSPGTFHNKSEWINSTRNYIKPTSDEIVSLFNNGFVVFDRELLAEKVLTDMFEPFGFDNNALILDKDYGLVLLPDSSRKKKNFYLGMSELERYGETYPMLKEALSNLFSIGALRGHVLLNNKLGYSPIEIEVNNKEELISYLQFIKSKIQTSASRFQVWFRGQSEEHSLSKLDPSLMSYCPWRSIVDISLIPSLFRKSELIQDDLKKYAKRLYEILNYEFGLGVHLNVPKYELRNSDTEKLIEYFVGTVWEDSNSPMYTKVFNEKNELLEIHDYNPIYRGLQTSLFLQHYGIQTNILDITKDIEVALFFAQHKMDNGKYKKVENTEKSVIYLFLLDPKTDRFLDSTELLESFGVQRPLRQKCGVLAGASYSSQNYYSRFISIKFKLKNEIPIESSVTPEYLFPPREEDDVLNFLTEYSKSTKMEIVKPF